MRLDKFLKVSRLIKRRTVANELSTVGGVVVNGKPAKPSSTVKVGDELTISLGNRTITVCIDLVPEKPIPAQAADSLYTVISEGYNS